MELGELDRIILHFLENYLKTPAREKWTIQYNFTFDFQVMARKQRCHFHERTSGCLNVETLRKSKVRFHDTTGVHASVGLMR